jgi:hypothetical protein
MRNLLEWFGRARSGDCRSWRGLRYQKILNPKPRLTGIEDIFEAKRKVKTTHVALDAV